MQKLKFTNRTEYKNQPGHKHPANKWKNSEQNGKEMRKLIEKDFPQRLANKHYLKFLMSFSFLQFVDVYTR